MELAQPLDDNPESILHNRRKGTGARESAKTPARPQSPVPSHPDRLLQSVEVLPEKNQGHIDYSVSNESPDEDSSLEQQNIDPEEAFNRKWGYLPPLDEEAAAIIDALIIDPTNAMESARINPTHAEFHEGLDARNVDLKENTTPDPDAANFDLPPYSLQETAAEKESYERLWTLDRAKCVDGSNEALFQRTLMMGFIARHCLVYGQDATGPSLLDFSVEETWNCPPMPTTDYYTGHKFLTQPKPDLAVGFKRIEVIPRNLWLKMPYATRRLACYEKPDVNGGSKAFHFFTIEGKRALIVTTDPTALYQSLNNASQALHNMFEFFNDAGPRHRAKFFSEVRFFSAVASTEGLIVRIHRAVQVAENGSEDSDTIPNYPLRFEFRELERVPREKFDRETVLKLLGKILVGYGVGKLFGLLQDAAKTLTEKLKSDPGESNLRQNPNFYRHGQVGNTSRNSRTSTLTASRGPSVQSPMSIVTERSGVLPSSATMATPRPNQSFDMSHGRTATPTQSQPPSSTQVSSPGAKRGRNQQEDGNTPEKSQRLRR